MIKLSFDYDGRANESVAYVGNEETALYRVRMIQDCSPENPFTAWDGHWPMIVDHGRRNGGATEYGDIPCPLSCLSDGQLVRHAAAIAKALDCDIDAIRADCREEQLDERARGYRSIRMADWLRDEFERALGDVSDSDKLATLEALFDIAGIPCLNTCSQGYSQGDYADLLIVAPWETAKAFGWNKGKWRKLASNPADMEGQADLYGAWAWGDVYGYVCEFRPDPESEWEELEEHGSSVWGFYGDDPAKSGLAESAAAHIEWDMRQRKESRFSRLAELIKARVPLAIRAAILGAPEFAMVQA